MKGLPRASGSVGASSGPEDHRPSRARLRTAGPATSYHRERVGAPAPTPRNIRPPEVSPVTRSHLDPAEPSWRTWAQHSGERFECDHLQIAAVPAGKPEVQLKPLSWLEFYIDIRGPSELWIWGSPVRAGAVVPSNLNMLDDREPFFFNGLEIIRHVPPPLLLAISRCQSGALVTAFVTRAEAHRGGRRCADGRTGPTSGPSHARGCG